MQTMTQAARAYGYPREDYFLEAARGDDWVGVQAYTRTFIGPDGPRPIPERTETTLTGWEYYPPALGIGAGNAWELTGGVPIFVTENGIATADDSRRIDSSRLRAMTGSITFNSKLPADPPKATAASLPITCDTT